MSSLYPIKTLIQRGTGILSAAGIKNARLEAVWLAESAIELSAQDVILRPDRLVSGTSYLSLIRKRAKGEPLQYLLGSQDFMGMELKVGHGVLIPRPETELLCHVGAELTASAKPVILDLCAGSGCVCLGLRQLLPEAKIIAVEKYAAALRYLKVNTQKYGADVRIVKADILVSSLADLPLADLMVSNPPYIESAVLPTLQKEVQNEPNSALDGGSDGLVFYRRIAYLAKHRLKSGGALAVEIGAGQASSVSLLFEQAEFTDIKVHKDDAGLDRVISCRFYA